MELKPPADVGLFEALYSTRALRRFKPDPVDDETLFQVLDAAIRAPAGSNMQIWQTWASYGQQYVDDPSKIDELPRQMRLVVRSTDDLARHFAEVPVHLFVCGPPQAGGTLYPAIQNLLLAARGLGLGAVLTAFHRGHEQRLNELLEIPDGQVAHGLIPIDWPSDQIGPVGRRPVKKVVSLDSWGAAWPFADAQPDEGWRDRWVGD